MQPFQLPTYYILFAEKGKGNPTVAFHQDQYDKAESEAKRIAIETEGAVHILKTTPHMVAMPPVLQSAVEPAYVPDINAGDMHEEGIKDAWIKATELHCNTFIKGIIEQSIEVGKKISHHAPPIT